MREAPALAGVSRSQPRPTDAGRSKTPRPKQGGPTSLLGRAFARPGVTICGASFAALMTGIVANAVLFQKGHHPAPLFSASHAVHTQPAVAPPPPAAPVAVDPQPAVTPPMQMAAPPALAATAPVAPVPQKKAVKPHRPAATHAQKDSIGHLIGSLDAKATAPRQVKPAGARANHAHGQAAAADSEPEVAKNGVRPHY